MQGILLDYGLKPKPVEVLDSSRLKDFVDCPSKFYLRHILGLSPTRFDPSYQSKFDWGTCWHSVLETFHSTPGDREAKTVAALQTLDSEFPEYIVPDTDKRKRSKQRMVQGFFDYLEKWKELDSQDSIVRTEQYFNVYSDDVDLEWCGRIDAIRQKKSTGVLRVWDYKTASSMGSRYFDQHEVGFQFPGYVWAADQQSTEEITDITIDVFYMISASHDFFRRTFRYNQERIREWVSNVKRIRDRIFHLQDEYLYEPEAWVKNWNECTRYGTCQFFPVHSVAPVGDTRLRTLEDDYYIKRWDPLRGEEVEE